MNISNYTFTGFLPSGNPFLWYYDENKHTAFTTSISVATWDREPKIGDAIKIEKNPDANYRTERAWINDVLVFQYSNEKKQQQERISKEIYDNLKAGKGFL